MEIEFICVYTYIIYVNFYFHPYWFAKGNGICWLINELSLLLNTEATLIKGCVLEGTQ